MEVIRYSQQSYLDAVAEQEARVQSVLAGDSSPCLIFTEHPPTYTIGTSGSEQDVLSVDGFPVMPTVHQTGRGGKVTYHGPGQLVCYVIADLRKKPDLKGHVCRLETWMIEALKVLGVPAQRSEKGIGVWVDQQKKVASVGVRCRRWVTYHGIALNIDPDMRYFNGIVPCGIQDVTMTSLQMLGLNVNRSEMEAILEHSANAFFFSRD